MSLIANFLGQMVSSFGQSGRPVVDQTALPGLWDFTLEVAQAPGGAFPSPAAQDAGGPTLLEGLQEQLGVRLKPTRAIVSVPVLDHVAKPDDN